MNIHSFFKCVSFSYTGNFAIDEDVLRAEGVTNIDKYDVHPGQRLFVVDFR